MPFPYHYTILRYHADPAEPDFVAAGVLVAAPDADFIGLRTGDAPDRVGKAFPEVDAAGFQAALTRIEGRLARMREEPIVGGDVALFAARATHDEGGSFTWSEVGTGVADDPRDELERLLARIGGPSHAPAAVAAP